MLETEKMYILGVRGIFVEDLSYFSIEKDLSLDLLDLGPPEPFSEGNAESRKQNFSKFCPVVPAAVLFYFMGCDNHIGRLFIYSLPQYPFLTESFRY